MLYFSAICWVRLYIASLSTSPFCSLIAVIVCWVVVELVRIVKLYCSKSMGSISSDNSGSVSTGTVSSAAVESDTASAFSSEGALLQAVNAESIISSARIRESDFFMKKPPVRILKCVKLIIQDSSVEVNGGGDFLSSALALHGRRLTERPRRTTPHRNLKFFDFFLTKPHCGKNQI